MEWPYLELMDRILGHKPTTIPKSIVDSLAQSQGNNDSSPEMREVSKVDETLFGENSDTGTAMLLTSNTSTSTEASSTAQQGKANKKKKDQGETSLK